MGVTNAIFYKDHESQDGGMWDFMGEEPCRIDEFFAIMIGGVGMKRDSLYDCVHQLLKSDCARVSKSTFIQHLLREDVDKLLLAPILLS